MLAKVLGALRRGGIEAASAEEDTETVAGVEASEPVRPSCGVRNRDGRGCRLGDRFAIWAVPPRPSSPPRRRMDAEQLAADFSDYVLHLQVHTRAQKE
jgi:hypothetical protein